MAIPKNVVLVHLALPCAPQLSDPGSPSQVEVHRLIQTRVLFAFTPHVNAPVDVPNDFQMLTRPLFAHYPYSRLLAVTPTVAPADVATTDTPSRLWSFYNLYEPASHGMLNSN